MDLLSCLPPPYITTLTWKGKTSPRKKKDCDTCIATSKLNILIVVGAGTNKIHTQVSARVEDVRCVDDESTFLLTE